MVDNNEPDHGLFRGIFSDEGTDRNLTLLHSGDDLISAEANNYDDAILMVQSVGPVVRRTWKATY